MNDNAENDEHISVFGAIGAIFQLFAALLQLVFWGAIVIGLIYFIVKVILW